MEIRIITTNNNKNSDLAIRAHVQGATGYTISSYVINLTITYELLITLEICKKFTYNEAKDIKVKKNICYIFSHFLK